MKSLKGPTSDNCLSARSRGKSSGFTLLEVVISMTIISMLVLVLYQAFSMGVRIWEDRHGRQDETLRLEAATRLLRADLTRAVPYNIFWEEGEALLFAGGPGAMFYVTSNGTGSISGAGEGLYFACLYVDVCPEKQEKCLYLSKSSRPSPDFVQEATAFRSATDFSRESFSPDSHMERKSILMLEGIIEAGFFYTSEQYFPFAGVPDHGLERSVQENEISFDRHWVENVLPGQVRISLLLEGQEYIIHVPVSRVSF
ncbi:prepilin-type N-terminal cleavage/methylation domain-containing protein [Desulfonatronospira sp. MSAO_Bac3]|uniref:PulJ/GspJ family protein n=1 Tax=Desulfonatronospira sp. MSAO_Bac3 TaxID=2293857 RepID=UPI00257E2CD4|nr:prepilin-type N-terminal cleavage/methylation domain-containing protein [Desulfonatronospira sp. MSAO_Bac3]